MIAIVGWTLSTIIDLPLIGKKLEPYVANIQKEFSRFTEANNYRPNFDRLEKTLNSIDATLAEENARMAREKDAAVKVQNETKTTNK